MDEAAGSAYDMRAAAQRRWWWVGLGALAVLVVATIAVLASGGDDDTSAAPPTSAGIDVSTSDASDGGPTTDGSEPGSTATIDATDATGSTVPEVPGTNGTEVATTTAGASTTLLGTPSEPTPTVPFVPGNGDTVPVQTVVTAPPVAIDEEADAGTGMTFRLERLEAVQGEANGPGEIAGPAVRVTISATNDTGAPVLLETIVVDLQYGPDRSSAAPLSGPGAERFTGELAQGATASAVYVFDVPVDRRDSVDVIVSYTAAVSPVVFTGPAPRP